MAYHTKQKNKKLLILSVVVVVVDAFVCVFRVSCYFVRKLLRFFLRSLSLS